MFYFYECGNQFQNLFSNLIFSHTEVFFTWIMVPRKKMRYFKKRRKKPRKSQLKLDVKKEYRFHRFHRVPERFKRAIRGVSRVFQEVTVRFRDVSDVCEGRSRC